MANIVPIEKVYALKSSKDSLEYVISEFSGQSSKANLLCKQFAKLAIEDTDNAIADLPKFIYGVRTVSKDYAYGEATGGGPNQDQIVPLFNTLGKVYSTLSKEQRTHILRSILNYLDSLRNTYSQNHVELMHDPWLVMDICINRMAYFSGFENYAAILERERTWEGFKHNVESASSHFWIAHAICDAKYGNSTPDVRFGFYKEYPALLDKTLDGLAARINAYAQSRLKRYNEPANEGITHFLLHFDTMLHDRIIKKIEEKKWIYLEQN